MSTTLNQAREAIYQLFADAWGTTTAMSFDNEEFAASSNLEWVRVAVRHTASSQSSIATEGNRLFERLGAVFVQIFVPFDTGTQRMDELTMLARNVFEGNRIQGTTVRFRDVIARELGRDGKWYNANVEAQFAWEERR